VWEARLGLSLTIGLKGARFMSAMSSSAIRYFLAVTQAGSFRRAANLLHVSASAINRQISLLELDLGAALFERSRGRNLLKLTSAGEILLANARIATGALEQARSGIEALKGLRVGTVSLGAPEMFVHHFLPEFLLQFHKAHPGISFRISVGAPNELTEKLIRDDLDLAMIYHPPVRGSIRIAAQVLQPNCVMVRTDHPLAKRSSIRLAECAPYPLVMPEYGTRARELYDAMLANAAVEPSWIVTTTSYEMLRSMARVGLGAAIVSGYLTGNKPADAVLVPLRDCPPAILACCTRTGRNLSVAATAFVERLREEFVKLGSRGKRGK
jgi:DNA-binding transcriptional LysR family regulator